MRTAAAAVKFNNARDITAARAEIAVELRRFLSIRHQKSLLI